MGDFKNLNQMMRDAIDNLKEMLEGDSVVGTPINAGLTTVIPISKFSVGFVTGGYDMKTKSVKYDDVDDSPIAAIGGGVTLTPLGFLVVSDEEGATFIKTQGDSTDRWIDIIQSTVKNAIK